MDPVTELDKKAQELVASKALEALEHQQKAHIPVQEGYFVGDDAKGDSDEDSDEGASDAPDVASDEASGDSDDEDLDLDWESVMAAMNSGN